MNNSDIFLLRDKTVKSIRGLVPAYREAIKKSDCDKHDLQFNGDERFSIASVMVKLCAYTGYYGNSGCSTFGSVGDEKLFKAAFIQYLNANMEAILNGVADLIESKLEEDRTAYLAKLRAEIQRVEATKPASLRL